MYLTNVEIERRNRKGCSGNAIKNGNQKGCHDSVSRSDYLRFLYTLRVVTVLVFFTLVTGAAVARPSSIIQF